MAWIAYKLHYKDAKGIIDCKDEPTNKVVEALQTDARNAGRPDGITWQSADNCVEALIKSAKL